MRQKKEWKKIPRKIPRKKKSVETERRRLVVAGGWLSSFHFLRSSAVEGTTTGAFTKKRWVLGDFVGVGLL